MFWNRFKEKEIKIGIEFKVVNKDNPASDRVVKEDLPLSPESKTLLRKYDRELFWINVTKYFILVMVGLDMLAYILKAYSSQDYFPHSFWSWCMGASFLVWLQRHKIQTEEIRNAFVFTLAKQYEFSRNMLEQTHAKEGIKLN